VAVSIGVLGYGLLAFTQGIRCLPLFSEEVPEREEEEQVSAAEPLTPVFGGD